MLEDSIALQADADVVAAWKAAMGLSRRLGFGAFKQACLSGAVLELCRQVVERGAGGRCALVDSSDAETLRARVVVEGCAPELLAGPRGRLGREINVGPSLPAAKLHQLVETLHAEPAGDGARVTLTIHQSRAGRPITGRPGGAFRAARRPA